MPGFAPKWLSGEPVSASKLNKTVEIANNLLRARVVGSIPNVETQSASVLQLEIESIDNVNRTMIGITPGASGHPDRAQYLIELQPIFTEPSRMGVLYDYTSLNTRTADGVEDQEITPPFVVGENVYCLFDLQISAMIFVGDGRMWAQVP